MDGSAQRNLAASSADLQSVFLDLWQTALAYLPQVAGAALLLLLGWLVAKLMRLMAYRLLSRVGRWGAIERELKASGVENLAPKTVASLVFWVVFLLFFAAAGQVLGLVVITGGINRLAAYLPSLVSAVLVGAAGVVVANLAASAAAGAARSARIAQASLLGQAARVSVLCVTAIIALEQLGIHSTALVVVMGLLAGGAVGGAALAFGLGSRATVSNMVAARDLTRHYRIGQTIEIAGVRGSILRFTPGGVVLDTGAGVALVPATRFQVDVSLLLEDADQDAAPAPQGVV